MSSSAVKDKDLKAAKQISSLEYGREILRLEARSILCLAEALEESFEHAVQVILGMSREGRVIVSGMGKAGFVGMKISATLASTGVPSFFLHPAEAVHGDLGRYSKQDIALILSNSGETNEILRILPAIKRIGCPIISLTSDGGSTLARYSDVVIPIGKLDEAGPLGLAPTTSTTVMLAMGDALAMAILERQDFSTEQYALYHPGGALGRALMPVGDMMRKGTQLCVVPETMKTWEVVHRMTATEGRPGAACVVDGSGKLAGVFTDGNLRRSLENGTGFLEEPVRTVMTATPKTVGCDQLVQVAQRVLTEFKIDQVIVVNSENEPVGMVDIQDLVHI